MRSSINKKLIETTLEELLDLSPELQNKQYTYKKDRWKMPWINPTHFVLAGNDRDNLYVAARTVEKAWPPSRDELCIDADAHPCYNVKCGDKEIAVYDLHFLQNSSSVEGMARNHEKNVQLVQCLLEKNDHPLLKDFENFIKSFIKDSIPAIKEALIRNCYKKGLYEAVKAIHWPERRYFEILASKGQILPFPFDNSVPAKGVSGLFREQISVTEQQKTELFCTWYTNLLLQNGYREKIVQSQKAHDAAFKEYIESIEALFKSKGFRRVKQISGW